jgi:4-amino-4-deoxy-L-arabinose transferase-like glycosyltransferase
VPEALQIWREETVGRAVGDLGTEPLWYYVPHLFVLGLPWTPLAIAAAPASWRSAWTGGDARERFLWVWLLVQLTIVTASADKHSHYLLAAMPMLSLLAARQFNAIVARAREGKLLLNTRQAAAVTALVVIGAAIAAIALANAWNYLIGPVVAIVVMAAGGVATALWLLVAHRPQWAGLAMISALLCCSIGVNGWIMPGRDHRMLAAQFARKLRAELPKQSEVVAYGMGERNPVVFYLGSPVSRCESIPDVEAELAKSSPMLVLAYESDVLALAQVADTTHLVQAMLVEPGELVPKHPPLVLLELERAHAPTDIRRQASGDESHRPR